MLRLQGLLGWSECILHGRRTWIWGGQGCNAMSERDPSRVKALTPRVMAFGGAAFGGEWIMRMEPS